MWTICLQNTQNEAEGTSHLTGNEEACIQWLKENQVFYNEDNLNPETNEDFGSKYVLLDITDKLPVIDVVEGAGDPKDII